MLTTKKVDNESYVPDGVVIEPGVSLGPRVVFAAANIVVHARARLDAGSVIGEGVIIGQGAWVRAGAVVLKTVPAYAIVEGNPAQVVGYVSGSDAPLKSVPRYINVDSYSHTERPAQIPLGVGGCALYFMRKIDDSRGRLTVGEVVTELPFAPARYFAVFDVPSVELRGEHAHKSCKQFLICMHGSCRVLLDDGSQRCEVALDRPDVGVYMPERIWGTQYRYTPDTVLFVFASESYDPGDYLRTYDEFLSELKRLT